MKRFVAVFAALSFAAALSVLACDGMGKQAGMAGHFGKDVQRQVTKTDTGLKVTLTAANPEALKALQDHLNSMKGKDGKVDCPDCAFCGSDKTVTRTFEPTANGAILTITTSDKAKIEKLYAMMTSEGKEKGDCPMHKGEGKAKEGDCQHGKDKAASRT